MFRNIATTNCYQTTWQLGFCRYDRYDIVLAFCPFILRCANKFGVDMGAEEFSYELFIDNLSTLNKDHGVVLVVLYEMK